jgi:hypothetical protein
MGSIAGPYYLGSGELATSPTATRRDLRKVLRGALKLKIPLVIGSAGSAEAKPHLDDTLGRLRPHGLKADASAGADDQDCRHSIDVPGRTRPLTVLGDTSSRYLP